MHDNFKVEINAGAELGDKLSSDSVTAETDIMVTERGSVVRVERDNDTFTFWKDVDRGPLLELNDPMIDREDIPNDVFFAVETLPCADERDERGRRPTFVSAELNERRKSGEMHQPPRVAASLAN
jgi:hypothetical protein